VLQSKLFPKTKKEAPKEAESINHRLLVRAGFVDQLMSGSWTLLPLGWRVLNKINQIIREEMNALGAQEILMPLLHPKRIWQETGRWDKAQEVMFQFKDFRGKEYALSFTHEEVVMDILRKHVKSYQDLPLAIYHFSTKFRNEPRAKSGILRGREFMMKDLYSAHASEDDMWAFYEKVKTAYCKIFKRLGFNFRVVEAGGDIFTESNTHEFQVFSKRGEDTIYYCDSCDWGENKEIFKGKVNNRCPKCKKGRVLESRAIEVGNIFPLGTWYGERMKVYYTDGQGRKKPIWLASYGIGCTRILGVLVEVSYDSKGIIWFPQVAPFDCHLLGIEADKKAGEVYQRLKKAGIEVLYDDRDLSAGEKFNDADLIGIPIRLVVSKETGNKIERKKRTSDKTELLSLKKVIRRFTTS